MTTNKTIESNSELDIKARALLLAAKEYWDTYQRELGASAVVWLEADNGHFVLFTRSEHKAAIMEAAMREAASATAMFEPFTTKADDKGIASNGDN